MKNPSPQIRILVHYILKYVLVFSPTENRSFKKRITIGSKSLWSCFDFFKAISESCIYYVVIHKVWWNGNSFFRFLQFFHVICFLVSMFSSLRTEVRGDFNFHGTKWCCKPPVLLVGQKNCPLHEMLTRLVITENAFQQCFQ